MFQLTRLFLPVLYQGASKRLRYFEAWYYKQATCTSIAGAKASRAIAFIPGISRSAFGSPEKDISFVQMIDGDTGNTRFFSFPVDAFWAKDSPFELHVGDNRFSIDSLSVKLEDEHGRVEASLSYGPITSPKRSLAWPGVMGPYTFMPFMECYHGVVSLDHSVDGYVRMSGPGPEGLPEESIETITFDAGRGYIEKDWGRSMPQSWIWVQTNMFPAALGRVSLFFSLARIPWRGISFNGFICILYVNGIEYRYASYTGAKVELLEFDGADIRILVVDKSTKLELMIKRNHEGPLAAPVNEAMSRRISESADSWVRIILKDRHGPDDVLILDAVSPASGVELVGDIDSLKP